MRALWNNYPVSSPFLPHGLRASPSLSPSLQLLDEENRINIADFNELFTSFLVETPLKENSLLQLKAFHKGSSASYSSPISLCTRKVFNELDVEVVCKERPIDKVHSQIAKKVLKKIGTNDPEMSLL